MMIRNLSVKLLKPNRSILSSSSTTSSSSLPTTRSKSTIPDFVDDDTTSIYNYAYQRASENANSFDAHYQYTPPSRPFTVPPSVRSLKRPIRPHPLSNTYYTKSSSQLEAHKREVRLTPYATTGIVPPPVHHVILHDEEGVESLRRSGRLARNCLDRACHLAQHYNSGNDGDSDSDSVNDNDTNNNNKNKYSTTAEIDAMLHQSILEMGAYPSPLNYVGFPRSICSSINEVICHGIPDNRRLQEGDVASFDVSCYHSNGYHGDNCATVLIGDYELDADGNHVPRENFISKEQEELFLSGRRLVRASREALDAAIGTCRAGSCLTHVGTAISAVADAYGYSSVEKYRGHGIGRDFHAPPFVKHYTNDDVMELRSGMVFTIEPMLVEGRKDCVEWESDGWTVVTLDGGRASQFEHMVAIHDDGCEILTVPE